jgi:hypothetical protein
MQSPYNPLIEDYIEIFYMIDVYLIEDEPQGAYVWGK